MHRSNITVKVRGAIWGLEGLPDHGGSGGLAPRVISAAGKIFYRTTYNYIQWFAGPACRTALVGHEMGLPDRQEFAGPLAGPGVVSWSVKPNRSPVLCVSARNRSPSCRR